MKSDILLQRTNYSSKYKEKIKENTNFRSKILNTQKSKPKKMLGPLNKNQRYFEQEEVVIKEDVIDKIGLYQAVNIL